VPFADVDRLAKTIKERGSQMDIRVQKICIWSGPISLFMAVGGLYIAGFLPPPSPAATAEQIAALYRENSLAISIGGIIFMLSAAPYLMFIAVVSAHMMRIEGDRRLLTYLQLGAGATSIAPIIVAPLFWCAAALRPHSPEITQTLNDLGFLTMVMTTAAAMAQVLAVGLAVLSDKHARPVFPRWVALASFACVFFLAFGMPCALTRTGPFAWDGKIASGLENLGFLPWTLLMAVVLSRSVRQQEAEGPRAD
jgi:hypothetical protein